MNNTKHSAIKNEQRLLIAAKYAAKVYETRKQGLNESLVDYIGKLSRPLVFGAGGGSSRSIGRGHGDVGSDADNENGSGEEEDVWFRKAVHGMHIEARAVVGVMQIDTFDKLCYYAPMVDKALKRLREQKRIQKRIERPNVQYLQSAIRPLDVFSNLEWMEPTVRIECGETRGHILACIEARHEQLYYYRKGFTNGMYAFQRSEANELHRWATSRKLDVQCEQLWRDKLAEAEELQKQIKEKELAALVEQQIRQIHEMAAQQQHVHVIDQQQQPEQDQRPKQEEDQHQHRHQPESDENQHYQQPPPPPPFALNHSHQFDCDCINKDNCIVYV